MTNIEEGFAKGKRIDVGIDVHKQSWSVHVLCEGETIYHATLPPDPGRLIDLLRRFGAREVHTVYEAGPTGYWLHDRLQAAGFDSIVTPPSLVPHVGGRVKTDRRDSKKLAAMLAGGFLKRVYALSSTERAHRLLLRTRNQIERHRKQTQNQIKSMLLFHGKRPPASTKEHWNHAYLGWIESLRWEEEALALSIHALLTLYHHLDDQLKALTKQIERLATTDAYRERVALLIKVPGIGVFTAMAILLELQEVQRFRRADQLASYLGLTPTQHSSGDHQRMGRIPHCGNAHVRTRLVESSWTLIRYDAGMRATFERIKHQTGSSKKAITAIARRLALRLRRLLLDKTPYRFTRASSLVQPATVRPLIVRRTNAPLHS
jgi:transposase